MHGSMHGWFNAWLVQCTVGSHAWLVQSMVSSPFMLFGFGFAQISTDKKLNPNLDWALAAGRAVPCMPFIESAFRASSAALLKKENIELITLHIRCIQNIKSNDLRSPAFNEYFLLLLLDFFGRDRVCLSRRRAKMRNYHSRNKIILKRSKPNRSISGCFQRPK